VNTGIKYKVREGDSLFSIAERFFSTVDHILNINPGLLWCASLSASVSVCLCVCFCVSVSVSVCVSRCPSQSLPESRRHDV
jgi:spore germination protein YaaH